ncbi:MAG: NADPH-dependent FMN reductase [Sandaracinaceae bacterium]
MPEANDAPLEILGLAGSLRRASANRALLRAASSLLPDGARLQIAEIGDLPLYNTDLTADGPVAEVERLEARIDAADAVLIATPEYNYGVPGVLKNALDWASRPAYQSVFAGKPVAIIGASGSAVGTARAQGQLKQVLLGMVAEPFPYPEVLVSRAGQRFQDGELADGDTEERLRTMLEAFVAWVRRRA